MLTALPGAQRRFSGHGFHEAVIKLNQPVDEILRALAAHNVLGGYALGAEYPELEDSLLICATEKRSQTEMDIYVEKLGRVIKARTTASCPVRPKI
jgi:glycine dehydrogenase subunit 1